MRLARVAFAALLGLAVSDRILLNSTDMAGSEADADGRSAGAARAGAMLADQVRAGSLFLGRFRMKQALWARSLARDKRDELVPLPWDMRDRFESAKELLSGSFGETWAAYDKETERHVAIKIFYSTDAQGNRYHITWEHAAESEEVLTSLAAAAKECLTAQKMQIFAQTDPVGASRLMQCYEDHVTCEECRDGQASGTSSSGHPVRRDQALYQVLEDCSGEGGLPLSHWIAEQVGSSSYDSQSLQLFKELMQGLNYMTAPSHSTKWGHHDLKPDNIIVKRHGGQVYTKIIDFGGVTEITPALATGEPFATTPIYAPVEYWSHWRFDSGAPWSYDMYSAGCILHHLLTGNLTVVPLLLQFPKKLQEDIQNQCGEDRRCLMMTAFGTLKRRVEPFLTQDWGSNASAVPVAQSWLFGDEIVEPAFDEHAKFFLSKAGLLDQLVAMLSAHPGHRPSPSQVLATPFMERLAGEADPEFDASSAQMTAEFTYISSGVAPTEVLQPPPNPQLGASLAQKSGETDQESAGVAVLDAPLPKLARVVPPTLAQPAAPRTHSVHRHTG